MDTHSNHWDNDPLRREAFRQGDAHSGRAWEGYSPTGWEPCLRLWAMFSGLGFLAAAVVGLGAYVLLFRP